MVLSGQVRQGKIRPSLPALLQGGLDPSTRTHTHNRFTAPFLGLTKKSSSGLYGGREDNRGRHTNNLAGHHSVQTNQRPTSAIPHFYPRCPSCCNPPTLSWLGRGTKYAGLHTQWRGFHQNELLLLLLYPFNRLFSRTTPVSRH